MRSRLLLGLCGLVISVSVLGFAKPAPAATSAPIQTPTTTAPKVIELTMTSNLAPNSALSYTMIFWAKELEKRTNGMVKVGQMTWSGSLLKSDTIAQGVGKNIASVGYIQAAYIPSLLPMTNAVFPVYINEGTPWGKTEIDLYKNEPQIHNEWAKLNIRPIYFVDFPPQLLMTTFKINSIADFKARRFRAVGTSHEFIANLGGIPINIASAETYTGLQKGTVEGVSGNPAYTIMTSKFHEIIKQATNTRNGDYSAFLGAIINVDVYNGLPDIAKKVISDLEIAAPEYFKTLDKKDSDEGLDMLKKKGIDIVQVSPDAAKQWYKVIDPPKIWDRYAKDAEARGLNPRPILDQLRVKALEYEAKHPNKTVVEQWGEANPGYVKYIK